MSLPKTYRGPTAKTLLRIHWEYPVWKPPDTESDSETKSQAVRRALPREEALRYIAGDDPRPLLVLRECKTCNGTDDALLKGGEENEKTFLLSTWFHCVKVPADVLEEDHPFHSLFLQKNPEHLFVSTRTGERHTPLESATSRTELWKAMLAVLDETYADSPKKPLRKLANLLDDLDSLDDEEGQLASRRDEILEDDGPGSRKLKKVERELAELAEEREKLLAEVDEAIALELKEPPEAATPEEAAPEGETPEEEPAGRSG